MDLTKVFWVDLIEVVERQVPRALVLFVNLTHVLVVLWDPDTVIVAVVHSKLHLVLFFLFRWVVWLSF